MYVFRTSMKQILSSGMHALREQDWAWLTPREGRRIFYIHMYGEEAEHGTAWHEHVSQADAEDCLRAQVRSVSVRNKGVSVWTASHRTP